MEPSSQKPASASALERVEIWLRARGMPLPMSDYAYAFERYRRRRYQLVPGLPTSQVGLPVVQGLVSIVLPVYNGEAYLAHALDSILAQIYPDWELIAVDDGSTDQSTAILAEYAEKDGRIRLIRQENRRLPAALSAGFRQARGEYLTWTSDDNLLYPEFLQRMVACLQRHPHWDMIYANLDLIDEGGAPLLRSAWFRTYQRPRGSQHVQLPADPRELNTRPNNFISAAILYRAPLAAFLGDYSSSRFTVEDYDYWMKINALFRLQHADFREPLYAYRVHGRSLTSLEKDLKIKQRQLELMVWDHFRRDFYLTPLIWLFAEPAGDKRAVRLRDELQKRAERAGHLVYPAGKVEVARWPRLWAPTVYVQICGGDDHSALPEPQAPTQAIRALVCNGSSFPDSQACKAWDVCLHLPPSQVAAPAPGWLVLRDAEVDQLFSAIDIHVRLGHLQVLEHEAFHPSAPACQASVIVCTYGRNASLQRVIEALAEQSMPRDGYEVIVVNNCPEDPTVVDLVEQLCNTCFASHPGSLRLVDYPIAGLSGARNAGLIEARGEILCFLDDDAIPNPNWLELLVGAYAKHPEVGVVGGHVRLRVPEPPPPAFQPGWEPYWSQLLTSYQDYTEVEAASQFPWGANWSARRAALLKVGGFRYAFGRRAASKQQPGSTLGHEEMIAAALIQRLGYKIAILPQAEVLHIVDPQRFNNRHLRDTIVNGVLASYYAQKDLVYPQGVGTRAGVLENRPARRNNRSTGFFARSSVRLVWYHLLARLALAEAKADEWLVRLGLKGAAK